MSDLVDDLLLLARLDACRPLEGEPVDMTRPSLDASSDARVAGPGHRWTLRLPEEPVTIRGDRHRLHQMVANLLTNARTHTPDGTRIDVALAVRPGHVEIAVEDDGPGVPPALQPEIFERFTRAADHTLASSGGAAGLGLAIVQGGVRPRRTRRPRKPPRPDRLPRHAPQRRALTSQPDIAA